jgi:osmotically-inducible protein OsmY
MSGEISDEVRAGYARDPRVPHPEEIAISEQGGTVTLRGSVGSPHQLRAAVDIAKSVRGVRDVYSELSVDPGDHWDDDELKGRALQALISSGAPADDIDVGVSAAWVTLKGRVRHQSDSDAAFAAVSRLPGVGGITNEIVVFAPGGR